MAVHPLRRLAPLALPCLLAGCAGFFDEITLNADGSGTYRLVVFARRSATEGELQAFRASVRERAAKIAAGAGFTLVSADVKRDGTFLAVELVAGFPSLSVFASPALGVSADGGEWSFVVPREASFRDGRFQARVLRGSAPPRDSAIQAMLKGHEARFTVHFPGQVVETSGQAVEGSANWSFSLEELCDKHVEMSARWRSAFPFWSLGLGALVLFGLAVVTREAFRRARAR